MAIHRIVVCALIDMTGSNFALTVLVACLTGFHKCFAKWIVTAYGNGMRMALISTVVETIIHMTKLDFGNHLIASLNSWNLHGMLLPLVGREYG